ncbi:MAG: pyridoxamine 5'-phosphate oxidase family protein [Chitinispirillaceae bacterium]|nr:pyridoxamine 5'-phosphate oxidase family protein [Chitinispirillaceae bacterium]
MLQLPALVNEQWENREGPIVLTTVDREGTPNSIYAGCVRKLDDGRILVVDNYFDKTRKNIQSGTKGAVLFITKERKSFQIKGTVEYHKDDAVYAGMKDWVDPRYPAHAAAVVNVEQVYCGADRLV